MTEEEFEEIVAQEFENVPAKFRALVKNLALLVEDEPDAVTRAEHGLSDHETLLGLYRGVPNTERGDLYGVGMTLPDTITIYRLPVMEEALETGAEVRSVVRETLWHEIAHYFGMDEGGVGERENAGENHY